MDVLSVIFNLPSRAPNAKPASPFLTLAIADIAEKISGAPLPNASRVTPCREGVKKTSFSNRVMQEPKPINL